MERKSTYAAKFLSVLVLGALTALFMLRSHYCREWWPNMQYDGKEWDGANSFTMNVFAVMFLLSFGLIPFYVRTIYSSVLLSILIGVNLIDVFDRLVFHIKSRTHFDLATLAVIVLLILVDQMYVRRKKVA